MRISGTLLLLAALTLIEPNLPFATRQLMAGASLDSESKDGVLTLLGKFESDWRKHWKTKRLHRNKTKYQAVEIEGGTVLEGLSEESASIFYRQLDLRQPLSGQITWNWKVSQSLTGNHHEREKKGDDYSARVFVSFDDRLLKGKSRALCYVWAGREGVGETFPNPYKKSVVTVVLQSGNERAGQWVQETRDIIADYRTIFGDEPASVTGVAVMVDTDNTKSQATAWFNDIVLQVETPVTNSSFMD